RTDLAAVGHGGRGHRHPGRGRPGGVPHEPPPGRRVTGWPGGRGGVRTRRDAFRPSTVFLCLVAALVAAARLSWAEFGNRTGNVILFVVAGWLVSLCLHEYAHALTAYRSGDLAVADRGYLTLNPLRYTSPVLSIVIPLFF